MRYLSKSIFISLLLLLLSGCNLTLFAGGNDLNLNLIFEDAQGISVSSPLVFQGVVIGEVTNVALMTVQAQENEAPCQLNPIIIAQLSKPQVVCISLTIPEANRNLVRTDSDFMLQDASLVSVTHGKQIEMTVWDSASSALAANATILGRDNLLEFYWKRVERWEQGLMLGELTLSTAIEADGSIKRAYTLETNQTLPVESVLKSLLPAGEAGWETSRPQQKDIKLLKAARTFPSAASITSKNSTVSITNNTSLLGGEYSYTETFQPGQFKGDQDLRSVSEWQTLLTDWYDRVLADQEAAPGILWEAVTILADQFQAGVATILPLSRVAAVITVTMPAEVLAAESNATFVNGNQASWLLTVDDLNQGFEVRAVARSGFFSSVGSVPTLPPFWIVGGVVLLIVGGSVGGYMWHLKKQADIVTQRDINQAEWDEAYESDWQDEYDV